MMYCSDYVLATLKQKLCELLNGKDGRWALLYVTEILAMIAAIEADSVLGEEVEIE